MQVGRAHQRVIVEREFTIGAREYLYRLTSRSLVPKVESALIKRRAEIEKEIEQKKLSLALPFLLDGVRESLNAEVEKLESSPVIAILSEKVGFIEGANQFIYWSSSSKATSVGSETIFIVEFVKHKFYWRAIQITIKTHADFIKYEPYTEPSIALLDATVVFDKDSLSHFLNCPVPPPRTAKIRSRTQFGFQKLPTKGCLVGNPRHITEVKSLEGDSECTKLKKQWMSVSGLYRERHLIYPRNLKNSIADCTISSRNTQKSRRKHCQYYSEFRDISLKAIMRRHLANSFCCSFLSHLGNVRNKNSFSGEMN